MPRPPIQHHKQIIELGPDLKEALEDGSLHDLVVLHEQGQAAKGFLSTNVGALLAGLTVVGILMSVPVTQKFITSQLSFWSRELIKIAVNIGQGVIPSPDEVVADIARAAEEMAETAREAWDRINREIEQRRENGETPLGPGFPIIPVFPP